MKKKIPYGINASDLARSHTGDIGQQIPKLPIRTEQLGQSFIRAENVKPTIQGVFIDYFIRHYLASKLNIERFDSRASRNKSERSGKDLKLDRMRLGYEFFQIETDSIKIIEDIFQTSLFHCKFFGQDFNVEYSENYLTNDMLMDMVRYLDTIISSGEEILLNPVVGSGKIGICGDCDLIVGDTLIDIKVSGKKKTNQDFYQLYIYATLYEYNTGKKLNELVIYNPLLNQKVSIDIKEWSSQRLLNFFKDNIKQVEQVDKEIFIPRVIKTEIRTIGYNMENFNNIKEGKKKYLFFQGSYEEKEIIVYCQEEKLKVKVKFFHVLNRFLSYYGVEKFLTYYDFRDIFPNLTKEESMIYLADCIKNYYFFYKILDVKD